MRKTSLTRLSARCDDLCKAIAEAEKEHKRNTNWTNENDLELHIDGEMKTRLLDAAGLLKWEIDEFLWR